jgi:hypothetical protein
MPHGGAEGADDDGGRAERSKRGRGRWRWRWRAQCEAAWRAEWARPEALPGAGAQRLQYITSDEARPEWLKAALVILTFFVSLSGTIYRDAEPPLISAAVHGMDCMR